MLAAVDREGATMAAGTIQGDTFDLMDLFEKAIYHIEYYQREYAWSAEDVRTLVADLFDSFERAWQDGRAPRRDRGEPFFLGPFVFVEQDRQVRFLVDGQQRFTTLHLLFLHLRQMAAALGRRDVESKLDRVITAFYIGDRPRFRIDIEERQKLLEALYRDEPYELQPGASLSVRNLHERSAQISELIDERLGEERLRSFVDWLLTRVIMVGIRAPGRDSGFRIFESMNDRGARLTPVDLLKSFLLSHVGEGEEKLNQRWRHMLAELTSVRDDTHAPRTFLKAALIAHYATLGEEGTADSDSIEAGLNIWVRKNTDRLGLHRPEDFFRFVDHLIELAGHYRTFLRASRGLYGENGLEALFYNEVNGLTNQMALVLAAVRSHDTDTSAKEKAALAANFLDCLYVERVLADDPVQAKDFEPDLQLLIPRLRRCATRDDVADVLSAALPSTAFESVCTFGMRGNNKAQVRYLLARLTAYIETGCRRPNLIAEYLGEERAWQIEHLYANHPERHRHEVPDAAAFRALRARLGVLVLLRRSDNASYNDLPLEEKRLRYARENVLAAVLAPDYRKNNPTLKGFIADNGIEQQFREFGNESLTRVVEVRGELYRRLCAKIWAPAALGFSSAVEQPAVAGLTPAGANGCVVPPRHRPLRTDLARMMRAHVLTPGTRIEGMYRDVSYTATVDADGGIAMPSGDYFVSADEAGKIACGTRHCAGMAFWHVVAADGQRVSLRELRLQAQQDGRLTRGSRT
ncbi:DUF262 domain-containing protein [Streptacidiphilus sp. N1-10]|uniref:DUF262 domain-containing protein n=1 Tax=Streptacidiphilus jeojiensis TaxID=3229225 RepID=A0ABV6XTF7_9ACTN